MCSLHSLSCRCCSCARCCSANSKSLTPRSSEPRIKPGRLRRKSLSLVKVAKVPERMHTPLPLKLCRVRSLVGHTSKSGTAAATSKGLLTVQLSAVSPQGTAAAIAAAVR
jgi:hypothetical protein